MNNFPIYAEIPDLHKKFGKNYIVISPNKQSGGYDLLFFEVIKPKANPIDKDWSFELDDAFMTAEHEYGVTSKYWRKMK